MFRFITAGGGGNTSYLTEIPAEVPTFLKTRLRFVSADWMSDAELGRPIIVLFCFIV